ncbi:MAG: Shedu anti-phage system protein SduA domain-containing protein, partial [Aphanizomenon sp.]
MYQKRQEIEEAISSLKQLLSDEDALERHFQEWFENNPIVFNALGYKTYLAHPVLKLEDEDTLIPDFIVQRIDNLWEIFELKLPNTQILKDKKTRQTFYAPLHEYMQQCIDYSR